MSLLLSLLALPVTGSTLPDPYSGPALPPLASMTAPVEDVPEMEYTYAELNYLWTDSHDVDENVDGAQLIGSFELPANFFVQGSVSRQSGGGADLDFFTLGAGYHLPLTSRMDAFGILSFAQREADGSSFDDSGVMGEVGLRALVTPKIEVNGSVKWIDLDGSDTGLGVGARYYFANRLSVGGRIESIDSNETVALGVRLEF